MNGILRWAIIVYYVTHIPITIALDLQGLLHAFYPPLLQELLKWYVSSFKDPMMAMPQPAWFKSFIFWEIFQGKTCVLRCAIANAPCCPHLLPHIHVVPYFVYGIRGMLAKDNSIRIPSIIYGAHVTTTVSAILAELVFGPAKITSSEKSLLFALYLPYFIFPCAILLFFAASPEPFGNDKTNKKSR